MAIAKEAMKFYKEQLSEIHTLSKFELFIGFVSSAVLMTISTYGLLVYVSVLFGYNFNPGDVERYTMYALLGLAVATIIAGLICYIMYTKPKSISFPLRIHSFLKHGSGEYFLCPEVNDQKLTRVFKRSLYGSLLISGIALTIMSFELMVIASESQILTIGGLVMLVSVIVLPITMMQFYYAPWLIKDAGLFHLDLKDRQLSNVGDNFEDILEFFAGIDIFLVWLELTLNTDIWVAPFIILVVLGPLFAIVIAFTLVFMIFKTRALESMTEMLLEDFEVPDMVLSSEYIRRRILALVDRRMLVEDVVEEFETRYGEIGVRQDLMSTMLDMFEDLEEFEKQEIEDSASIREMREKRERTLTRRGDLGAPVLHSATTLDWDILDDEEEDESLVIDEGDDEQENSSASPEGEEGSPD